MTHFCTKNKYDSKFDKFIKDTQSKISDDEAAQRKRAAELEMQELANKAQAESTQAKQKLHDTQQTFSEFSEKKGQDEMSIKDLFKNISLKEHINEASSMFRGAQQGARKRVGSILEMRKQLFNKEKKEEIEKIIKEESKGETATPDDSHVHKAEEAKESPAEGKLMFLCRLKNYIDYFFIKICVR